MPLGGRRTGRTSPAGLHRRSVDVPRQGFFLDADDEKTPMPVVRANRKVKAGKHAILDVFPGLDKSVAFRAIFPDGLREEVLRDCRIDVVPEDMYMHVLRFLNSMPLATAG